jgi:hypothetical protein
LIEEVTVDRVTGQYLEIAVVQQEDEEGRRAEPLVYLGVHTGHGHKVVRHTAEGAYVLSEMVDAAARNRARTSLLNLLHGGVMPCLPVRCGKDDVEWLQRLPIALRRAAQTIRSRNTPCPPWCVAGHTTSWDTLHFGEGDEVALSQYPYWSGDECIAATISVGLRQDQDDRAPFIVLTSYDDNVEELMTVAEAEDLGRCLLHTVARARGET